MTRLISFFFLMAEQYIFYMSIFITTSYPLVYWLVRRLLPYLGYCKQCCNKHRCTDVFFWIPRSETDGLYVLGWCESYYGFALLNFAIWYWNAFLNKHGYIKKKKKRSGLKQSTLLSHTVLRVKNNLAGWLWLRVSLAVAVELCIFRWLSTGLAATGASIPR